MNDDELIRMVKTMRDHQKEFFRLASADRPPALISKCKTLEKAVDAALEARRQGQGRLFPAEGRTQDG